MTTATITLPATPAQIRRLESSLARLDYIDRIQLGIDGLVIYTDDGIVLSRPEASELITRCERFLSRRNYMAERAAIAYVQQVMAAAVATAV